MDLQLGDGVQIGGSVRRGEDEDLITRRESKRSVGGSRSRSRLRESRWLMRAMPKVGDVTPPNSGLLARR